MGANINHLYALTYEIELSFLLIVLGKLSASPEIHLQEYRPAVGFNQEFRAVNQGLAHSYELSRQLNIKRRLSRPVSVRDLEDCDLEVNCSGVPDGVLKLTVDSHRVLSDILTVRYSEPDSRCLVILK